MARFTKDENLAWINVKVSDLAEDIQADIAAYKATLETEKTLKESIRDKMVRDARAAGRLPVGMTLKLSFFYLNREDTLGFVTEAETAKKAKADRVFVDSSMFAPAKLFTKDETGKVAEKTTEPEPKPAQAAGKGQNSRQPAHVGR